MGLAIISDIHANLHALQAVRFVKTGTVGKPRDGDVRAGYAPVNPGMRIEVPYRRLPYDVAAAAAAVRRSGLPGHFADLLETGGLVALSPIEQVEASVRGRA
jgi:diadenosine tetraphosphatase ApaH/serine/threonine PP2A family protein phosphatase